MISNLHLFFSLVLAVCELWAILWLLTQQELQNITGTHAATWRQEVAADLSQFWKK